MLRSRSPSRRPSRSPTVAFAGRLGDLLGISNGGTTVSTSDVLPGYPALDQAMQELHVGGTMQYLGTLNGVAFYATRNASGDFCIAINHVNEQYDKGFGCLASADNFPSGDVKALTFPPATMLDGVAADGVATVEALDADGNVLASTPVVNNLFVGGVDPAGRVGGVHRDARRERQRPVEAADAAGAAVRSVGRRARSGRGRSSRSRRSPSPRRR